jgi:hypothetical protein
MVDIFGPLRLLDLELRDIAGHAGHRRGRERESVWRCDRPLSRSRTGCRGTLRSRS